MNFYPRRRRMPQVIIVSMIDIFAILLIFVIVTTTFKVPVPEEPPKPKAVIIKLPESSSAVSAETPKEVTIIKVAKLAEGGEKVFLNDKEVSLLLLTQELKALIAAKTGPKPAFAMSADENISYGFLIKVLDALKDGGVQGNLSAFTETKK